MADFTTGMGAGAYLQLSMQEVQYDVPNNRSLVNWQLYLVCGNGASWNADPTGWSANIAGQGFSGSYTYDFRGGSVKLIASGSVWAGHNGDGSGSVYGSGHTNYTGSSIGGPADVGGTMGLACFAPLAPQGITWNPITSTSIQANLQGVSGGPAVSSYIMQMSTSSSFPAGSTQQQSQGPYVAAYNWTGLQPATQYWFRALSQGACGQSGWVGPGSATTAIGVPGAPTGLAASGITPTGMTVSWTDPSYTGGEAPSQYDVQYSLNSDMSGATVVHGGTHQNSQALTGLLPGNTYYVQVRVQNSAGVGPWSSTLTQTTLPSTPPSVTVLPLSDGVSANVILTPPSGVSGVDRYLINVVDTVTSISTPYVASSSPYRVTGLQPGRAYTYSAAAVIGGYTSPYSTPVRATQLQPSGGPGVYWDGATPATNDVTYAWTGTADASTSTQSGNAVSGWQTTLLAAQAVLTRVSGGYVGDYAARLQFLRDGGTSSVSWTISQRPANVSAVIAGGIYVLKGYLNPSKQVTAGAMITWLDSNGTQIGTSIGPSTSIPGGRWSAVKVIATAPDNAAFALLGFGDFGVLSGFVQMLGGDYVLLDAVSLVLNNDIPYFDGDTPDQPGTVYDWTAATQASTSTKTPRTPDYSSLLDDPDCPPPPTPPTAPAIEDDCVIEVGQWRRYWVTVPAERVGTWIAVVPTITMTTGSSAAREVRVRYFANPDVLPPMQIDPDSWEAEQIIRYMPPSTVMTVDGVSERAWASVSGSDSIAADDLIYGTGGGPATWPLLRCGVQYLIALDTPLDSPAGNLTVGVALTNRML